MLKPFSIALILSTVSASAVANITVPSSVNTNNINFHVSALYLEPNSNNLKYAVFVSGNQPYQQSWHNQVINPGYSPAFELGISKRLTQSDYELGIEWLHLNSSDSSSKQAALGVNPRTIEFVAPPYDVGPAVFGIKRATSNVKTNFNSVLLNLSKEFNACSNVTGKIIGGLSFLSIDQNLKTTFSDLPGAVPIPTQAYALPPDPNFYFTSKNSSNYFGVGPDLGFNVQYLSHYGVGVLGQFIGSITAGTIKAKDNFTSSSNNLIQLGYSPSHQQITVPNSTQLVPGIDSKLGLFYAQTWRDMSFSIEAGYRFTYYFNAIATISPDSLVQARDNSNIPEFSTGTMAINATTSSNSPFSMSGPYLNFTVGIA